MGAVGMTSKLECEGLLKEKPLVLALAQNDEPAAWCHRHLARGEQVLADHTKVWIERDVLVTTPDLCQQCLDDLDSWLRLFGIREAPEDRSAE
jgi:hypothetical protein